ncbi:MAG TPA: GAF domain-containing protein [Caldilineae bacterium]|nr:GAF domain-containing protein [Caldilineae bacterium]
MPTTPRLFDALARLNEIGAAINSISAGDEISIAATLRLIVESATEVVPGAAAMLYAYDAQRRGFDTGSRVWSGALGAPVPGDEPRPHGLGNLAIRQGRRVLSYEEPTFSINEAKARAGAQTVGCFPLVVARQPVGVLYVYLHEQRRFSELELLMLENFVNQAAMAVHRARALTAVRRDLERKEDELARLRRADLLISSRLRLEETLEAILQMALEVTGARYGIFRLLEREKGMLVTRAWAGEDLGRPAVEALPADTTNITGWVATTRKPLVIADVHQPPWNRLYYPLDHDLAMRSELVAPLLGAGGRLEGVLNLESPRVGAFSEDDSLLLQSLATQAVIAIQEVRLLDALQELSERLLSDPLQQVCDRLVDLASDLLDAPLSALWLLQGDELVLQSSHGGQERARRLSLDGSLTGMAVSEKTLVVARDVRLDDRFARPDLARRQGWAGALIAPVSADEASRPLGALSVYGFDAAEGALSASDWDKKVLTFLAHHAALAVQNAKRREALRRAQEQQAAAETFAAVGDIAANLLHRLNNKIGTIPVRVEGIQDKSQAALRADAYLANNLAEIERSAVEAMEALRDSLFYLRPIHLAPVDVAAALVQARASVDVPAGVRISTGGLQDLPLVMAGRRRLALVFVNLLENAIAAMQGQGEISVRGEQEDGWVQITVSDSGPGIPPELHDRIFEFDYSGAARSSGKLGFGLWWVRTIMARFGGSIGLAPESEAGAAFILRLPVEGAA